LKGAENWKTEGVLFEAFTKNEDGEGSTKKLALLTSATMLVAK
jgi:hypothetical protein